jgi:hypothetical protein
MTGFDRDFLSRLSDEVYPRIGRDVADAILQIDVSTIVTPIGVLRRLQALTVQGWGSRSIASAAEVSRGVVLETLHEKSVPRLDTRRRIARVYEDMKDANPLSVCTGNNVAMTKRKAADAGWLPPHGWEDAPVGIDDPCAKPVRSRLKERHAELFGEYRFLLSCGVQWDEATRRLAPGWKPESMERRAYRLGYGDIVREFRREAA